VQVKYDAYFPWGRERIPEHVAPLGVPPFHEDNAVIRAWYDETLRSGRRFHGGAPITEAELSFEAVTVFP
jgi:hypothetical protein